MKMGKILLAGVAATVFSSIFGMVTCGWIFSWVYKIEPVNIWKNMDAPPGIGLYAGSLALYVILACVYALLNRGIPSTNKIVKGAVFGLCIWAAGTLPGMFSTYFFMTVAPVVVLYWTLTALISYPIIGVIIAAVYGE